MTNQNIDDISKGHLNKYAKYIRVSWQENKITKNKKFSFCKYKRTDEETERLAKEFLKTIEEKHKLWKDHIVPIRKEKKNQRMKAYQKKNYISKKLNTIIYDYNKELDKFVYHTYNKETDSYIYCPILTAEREKSRCR